MHFDQVFVNGANSNDLTFEGNRGIMNAKKQRVLTVICDTVQKG